jgi:hypothetical protein
VPSKRLSPELAVKIQVIGESDIKVALLYYIRNDLTAARELRNKLNRNATENGTAYVYRNNVTDDFTIYVAKEIYTDKRIYVVAQKGFATPNGEIIK